MIFLWKIEKTTSILELAFSPNKKWSNFLKTEIFLKKLLTNSLMKPECFFKSLPILCKVVTTGGFLSSKLQICWFWSEKHFYLWIRSTYSGIFWYHKLAINRRSRVIRQVGGRIYGVPSHGKRRCTRAHFGWSFC